jgi:protease-4
MAQRQDTLSIGKRIGVSIILLLVLFLASALIAVLFNSDTIDEDANTAIIRVIGPIVGDSADGIFDEGVASSTDVIEQLEQARDDPDIKAIILEINSPGGSAVASDEIAQEVKRARADGKIVVAWIRESGASGAYWIASSTDHIVANRMSITGSIGVISSYLEFAEFIDEWNVTYRRLVAGERKDVGDPFQELDHDDRAYLQGKLDRVHAFFIDEVARNRNMPYEQVAQLADGSFMLGIEAQEAGLVDELGGEEEVLAYIENVTGVEAVTTLYEPEGGLLDDLFGTVRPAPQPDLRELARQAAMRESTPAIELR